MYVEGTLDVPLDLAGGSATDPVVWTIDPGTSDLAEGTYSLFVAINDTDDVEETSVDNNTFARTVEVGPGRPDLRIEDVRFLRPPTPGAEVRMEIDVVNEGHARLLPGWVSIDLEALSGFPGTPAGWSSSIQDYFLLDPGETFTVDRPVGALPAGFAEGSYVLQAQVDSANDVDESNEDNNFRWQSFDVVPRAPDLKIVAVEQIDRPLVAGGRLGLRVHIRNDGVEPLGAQAFPVFVELFEGAGSSPIGLSGGWNVVGPIAVGETITTTTEIGPMPAGLGVGTHRAEFEVDQWDVVSELDESNNTFSETFEYEPNRPDLVVSEIIAPEFVTPGLTFSFEVAVTNQGHAPVAASSTQLRTNVYGGLWGDEYHRIITDLPAIQVGQTVTVTRNLQFFGCGEYHGTCSIFARADSERTIVEHNEFNNTGATSVWVGDTAPNLRPVDVRVGDVGLFAPWSLDLTILNEGYDAVPSGVLDVEVVVFDDLTSTEVDRVVLPTNAAWPGTTTQTVALTVPTPAAPFAGGDYRFEVHVDPADLVVETSETDNGISGLFAVTDGPDLLVHSLEIENAPLSQGGDLDATITVHNAGTEPARDVEIDVWIQVSRTVLHGSDTDGGQHDGRFVPSCAVRGTCNGRTNRRRQRGHLSTRRPRERRSGVGRRQQLAVLRIPNRNLSLRAWAARWPGVTFAAPDRQGCR